jgi:protein arginine kinase activator
MSLEKCFFCNKYVPTMYHLTEVNEDGSVEVCHLCAKCGEQYIRDNEGEIEVELPKKVDLTHIKTPEELLSFLSNIRGNKATNEREPCVCGTTVEDFEKTGRFGCAQCYEHFRDKLEEQVFPYHGASEHVGKRPVHQLRQKMLNDPVEKEKLLKLQYAKALELEQYEKAAEFKKELNALKAENQPAPETSSDQ